MTDADFINAEALEKADQVLSIGKDYIPTVESRLRKTILAVFQDPTPNPSGDIGDYDLLGEAVFWSLGELINNANKANNRWAILRNALYQRVKKDQPDIQETKLLRDIDYAIEHNQVDLLKKYGLQQVDLTSSILKLIELHKTNSFALSEKFSKKIDVTLRIRKKGDSKAFTINVINNSPITIVDKNRVEFNLEKIKEDLMNAGRDAFQAAVKLYDKQEDHAGGGFGAGLRSIVLFLREGYRPFGVDIMFSKLIQYRSAGNSTIFSIEIPVPKARKAA
ncbi:MAG: hypothetical protein HY042_01745 [Spirochaetia bacterium]|nr:hypothetical protein [Spirochaetia bacterium]